MSDSELSGQDLLENIPEPDVSGEDFLQQFGLKYDLLRIFQMQKFDPSVLSDVANDARYKVTATLHRQEKEQE